MRFLYAVLRENLLIDLKPFSTNLKKFVPIWNFAGCEVEKQFLQLFFLEFLLITLKRYLLATKNCYNDPNLN